jgi:hypothetical protein
MDFCTLIRLTFKDGASLGCLSASYASLIIRFVTRYPYEVPPCRR